MEVSGSSTALSELENVWLSYINYYFWLKKGHTRIGKVLPPGQLEGIM